VPLHGAGHNGHDGARSGLLDVLAVGPIPAGLGPWAGALEMNQPSPPSDLTGEGGTAARASAALATGRAIVPPHGLALAATGRIA
jgi:hypothetical protein